MSDVSRLLITMGDVAGIGPEIIAAAWPDLLALGQPIVVGDPGWMTRALALVGSSWVQAVTHPSVARPALEVHPVRRRHQEQDLRTNVLPGEVSAAGRAAYDFLCAAIRFTTRGDADAIVTCPLHKEGLHAAGVPYPGHTEILAERTGASSYAMLLHGDGVTVAHVTLHMALQVFTFESKVGARDD